jgi:ferredoxin-NADP reductase
VSETRTKGKPQRRIAWRLGEVIEVIPETPRTKSLILGVPGWEGHKAGQHVDVRLTAPDGYQAQRSYSIGSAPEDGRLMLTVERLEEGEVSPYLTDVLEVGDRLELRGPIGATSPGRPGTAAPSYLWPEARAWCRLWP